MEFAASLTPVDNLLTCQRGSFHCRIDRTLGIHDKLENVGELVVHLRTLGEWRGISINRLGNAMASTNAKRLPTVRLNNNRGLPADTAQCTSTANSYNAYSTVNSYWQYLWMQHALLPVKIHYNLTSPWQRTIVQASMFSVHMFD